MDFDTALAHLSEGCEYVPIGTVHGHAGVREVPSQFFETIHENEAAKIHDPSAA